MAIFHYNIKIVARGNVGRRDRQGVPLPSSCTATAAYISAGKIKSERDQKTHRYTGKRKEVVHHEVLLPDNAPTEYKDSQVLWNAVDSAEKQKDAQTARLIIFALPRELPLEEQIRLARKHLERFRKMGMCVDFVIHDAGKENPHVHALLTVRAILPDGRWAPKARKIYDLDKDGNRIPLIDPRTGEQRKEKTGKRIWKSHKESYTDWDCKENAEVWREWWEEDCNEALGLNGHIDHRSYRRQAKDLQKKVEKYDLHLEVTEKIPTRHEGFAARQRLANAEEVDIIEENRLRKEANEKNEETAVQIAAAKAQLRRLERELKEERKENARKYRELKARFDDHVRAEAAARHNGRDVEGDGPSAERTRFVKELQEGRRQLEAVCRTGRDAARAAKLEREHFDSAGRVSEEHRNSQNSGGVAGWLFRPGKTLVETIRTRIGECVDAIRALRRTGAIKDGQYRDPESRRYDQTVAKPAGADARKGNSNIIDGVRRATSSLRSLLGFGGSGQENPDIGVRECAAAAADLRRSAGDARSRDSDVRTQLDERKAARLARRGSRNRRPSGKGGR